MTCEEAKDYALTHLPCTMSGIVALFDTYFHGTARIEKLVGIQARTLGYSKLVFYVNYGDSVGHMHPANQLVFLRDCFKAWCKFHDFRIEKESVDMHSLEYVYWVKPLVEIKEDRR